MEVHKEPDTNPIFEMRRQLSDAQRGLITFRMLTKALVELSKAYPEPSENKERGAHVSRRIPPSEPQNMQ